MAKHLEHARWAGILLFFGGAEFWLFNMVSETLYPGYSVHSDFLSALGAVGSPTEWIWDTALFVLGLTWSVGVYLLFRRSGRRRWMVLNLIPAISSVLVGLFPAYSIDVMHVWSAYVFFASSGLVAIADAKFIHSAFRYFSIALGLVILAALFWYTSFQTDLLGVGGVERLVVYPAIIWVIGFGSYVMSTREP